MHDGGDDLFQLRNENVKIKTPVYVHLLKGVDDTCKDKVRLQGSDGAGMIFQIVLFQGFLQHAEEKINPVGKHNGENTFLFMGDAQTERLEEYLEGTVVDCDVLKVPHHGGEEILMEALIRAAKPELAVITSSDEEPEAASTTAVLDTAKIETYLTREGDILMVSDGTTISVVEK